MKTAVVVPTCRPDSFRRFVKAWTPQFERHNVELIVVEDNEATWRQLPWFIPSRSGSIRSWGLLQAWRKGYDVINLDDDVLPADDVDLIDEYASAFRQHWPVSDYFDIGHTFGVGEYMRGYPFADRDAATPLLQYGGWDNVPDLDAVTQGALEEAGEAVDGRHFDRRPVPIPRGAAFTGCIMNVAVRHEAIPLLYQLIMGNERVGYDRWDDIWSGLFAKRICDHLGRPILVNGRASAVHTRASSTASNLEKERGGYDLNERMWVLVSGWRSGSGTTPLECYAELTTYLRPEWFGPRGAKILSGMWSWLDALQS